MGIEKFFDGGLLGLVYLWHHDLLSAKVEKLLDIIDGIEKKIDGKSPKIALYYRRGEYLWPSAFVILIIVQKGRKKYLRQILPSKSQFLSSKKLEKLFYIIGA